MLADNTTTRPAEEEQDEPSIPLYVAGLLVAIAALQCVNLTVMDQGQGDAGITMLLAAIGTIFSAGCRLFKIRTYIPELLGFAVVAYAVYGIATGAFNPVAFAAGGNESQLLLARGLAWTLVAMSWALVSDGMVVFLGLLSIAAIGVIGSLNPNSSIIGYFALYVFAMLFLLVHQHYLHVRQSAPEAERLREQGRPIVLQISVAALCTAVVFTAGSLIVVPAQVLTNRLSLSQAIRKVAGLSTQGTTQSGVGPYVSDDPDFTVGTGQGWTASAEVVAHVSSSDHQPHYWRARTYDRYTGAGWTSSFAADVTDIEPTAGDPVRGTEYRLPTEFQIVPPNPSPSPDVLATQQNINSHIDMKAETPELIYTGEPTDITIEGQPITLELCKDGNISQAGRIAIHGRYMISSVNEPLAEDSDFGELLRHAPTHYPLPISSLYLGGVTNEITTDDDVLFFRQQVNLALRKLPPGHRTEYDKALAIQNYVSETAVYSLSVPALPADTDHVRDFLGNTRKGYCDMFASSMAVLCRVAGIPARVATGFDPGIASGDGYDLRSMDKHAWVEVYFPKYGWVTFDATTNAQTDSPSSAHSKKATPSVSALWTRYITNNPVALAVLAIIACIVAYVGVTEWRARHKRLSPLASREAARTLLGQTYARLTLSLGRLGAEKKPSETPLEYLRRVEVLLPNMEKRLNVSLPAATMAALTHQFVQARYAGQPPEVGDLLPSVNVFLRNARRGWLRVLLIRLTNRGREISWN